jgi:hypothetical protein
MDTRKFYKEHEPRMSPIDLADSAPQLRRLFTRGFKDLTSMIAKAEELKHTYEGDVGHIIMLDGIIEDINDKIYTAILKAPPVTLMPPKPKLATNVSTSDVVEITYLDFDSANLLALVEKELIRLVLTHVGDNRTHAAPILGISVRTLRNKLATYRKEGV